MPPPPRIVFLSSLGSQHESSLGNITTTHLLEEAVGNLPLPTAFVRPGSFIENYLYGLHQARATGAFDISLSPTSRPVPMTATDDVGAQVARLLVSGWQGKKIVEIGTRISPDDLAHTLSEVLGREVQVRRAPRTLGGGPARHGLAAGFDRPVRGDDGRDQLGLDRLRRTRHGVHRWHDHARAGLRIRMPGGLKAAYSPGWVLGRSVGQGP